MAIPCFWFSCYFVSGRGTKAWLDVLYWSQTQHGSCSGDVEIVQVFYSLHLFFVITKQYKRIHINYTSIQNITLYHLCCLPNLVLSVSKRWQGLHNDFTAPRPKPMWNRRYSVSCPRCGPRRKWRL